MLQNIDSLLTLCFFADEGSLTKNDRRHLLRRSLVIKTLKIAAVLGFALAAQSVSSQAVTIGFGTASGNFNPYFEGDFQVSSAQLTNGNCAAGACLLLNTNSTSILSLVSGGLFTLNSFWFKTLDQPSVVNVEAFVGNTSAGTFSQIVPKNTAQTISLLFADVTSIRAVSEPVESIGDSQIS
jgi:hypothetical protein